jgi:hypothetical protein
MVPVVVPCVVFEPLKHLQAKPTVLLASLVSDTYHMHTDSPMWRKWQSGVTWTNHGVLCDCYFIGFRRIINRSCDSSTNG